MVELLDMADTTALDQGLKSVYDLIKDGQLDTARTIIVPMLENHPDSPDVWWLYAHALTNVEQAQMALYRVLQIDPEYPEARSLLDKLEMQIDDDHSTPVADTTTDREPPFLPALPTAFSDERLAASGGRAGIGTVAPASLPSELPELQDEDDGPGQFLRPVVYVPLLLLALLAAIIVVLNRPFANQSGTPDLPPTSESQGVVVQTPVDSLAWETSRSAIVGALQRNSIRDADVRATTQPDGLSLVSVRVCTSAGLSLRQDLSAVAQEISTVASGFPETTSRLRIEMTDCISGTALRVIGIDTVNLIGFAEGVLNEEDFESTWRAIE